MAKSLNTIRALLEQQTKACEALHEVWDGVRGVGGALDLLPMLDAERGRSAVMDAISAADAAQAYIRDAVEASEVQAMRANKEGSGGRSASAGLAGYHTDGGKS